MADLVFDEEADRELSELENEPSNVALVRALQERVFRVLANDPTDPSLRRRRFSKASSGLPGLWAVTIWVGNEEISVLWDGEDLPETVLIRYIGKLPHR
jgi:hypothetical protein